MVETGKLGLWRLVAIVFGSVIGGSIFNIAQNMAHGAALGAVICAWCVTGIGIMFLVQTFRNLVKLCPDLNAGIYEYAQVGFGNYCGFNMAWGYWLCVILGNVTYAVLLNDSLGAFFPVFSRHGWQTVVFGTALVWLMYYIVTRGIQSASYINTFMSVLKFGCIVFILVILAINVKIGYFTADFWGNINGTLPSVGGQVSSCMLVTIWSFLGIEGAMMMSSRAKRHSDVGKATIIGFILALILYLLVTTLCFGIMSQPQLASLPNPSLAYALEICAGSWAKWFVISAIVVSVAGGFVAWTLLCAQTPYEAAVVKIFPHKFLSVNSHGVPAYGMRVSSVAMTLCLLLVVTAEDVYLAAVNLASMMILPCYFFCGLYLMKLSFSRQLQMPVNKKLGLVIVSAATMMYCAYSMWAGSLCLLMLTSTFYLAGMPFFVMARKHNSRKGPTIHLLTAKERLIFVFLLLMACISLWMLLTGKLVLDG